jgi:hypothetical protein
MDRSRLVLCILLTVATGFLIAVQRVSEPVPREPTVESLWLSARTPTPVRIPPRVCDAGTQVQPRRAAALAQPTPQLGEKGGRLPDSASQDPMSRDRMNRAVASIQPARLQWAIPHIYPPRVRSEERLEGLQAWTTGLGQVFNHARTMRVRAADDSNGWIFQAGMAVDRLKSAMHYYLKLALGQGFRTRTPAMAEASAQRDARRSPRGGG